MPIVIEDCSTISPETGSYDGWATVTRCRNGQLWLAYSGSRQRHICPFGRVEVMMSPDGGEKWSLPRVLLDTVFDDRDGGVVETSQGSLLVSTFSSKAFRKILHKALKSASEGRLGWPEGELARWQLAELAAQAFGDEYLGQWIVRSTDGGATWSAPIPSLVNAPHGPVVLSDGGLIYAGKAIHTSPEVDAGRNGVCRSRDDGQSWHWLADIPTRAGDEASHYHELHAVEAASGRLIVHIRNENPDNADETLQSVSDDGGLNWSVPRPIGVWGLPSHLLRLADGRLLMTYGYRRPPFGNQARISDDHGQSWSAPLTISDDGTCTDLGYPSTVELSDNRFLTVWYERKESARRAVLRQARWSLSPL